MSRYPSDEVERFDRQFAESEDERNERLSANRAREGGKRAARAGHPRGSNPYLSGGIQRRAWDEGYTQA